MSYQTEIDLRKDELEKALYRTITALRLGDPKEIIQALDEAILLAKHLEVD